MTKEDDSPKQETTPDDSSNNNDSADSKTKTYNVDDDEWMVRPCDVYYDEYDDCMSMKGRFHQYFIFGEPLDCNQWKKDFDNCQKWKKSKDVKAMREVIRSENYRRHQRLKAHFENDTWEVRKEPPKDWNNPLPEWMQKRDENTYLAIKAQELKDSTNSHDYFPHKTYCSIM